MLSSQKRKIELTLFLSSDLKTIVFFLFLPSNPITDKNIKREEKNVNDGNGNITKCRCESLNEGENFYFTGRRCTAVSWKRTKRCSIYCWRQKT